MKSRNIILALVSIIAIILLARYVVFKQKFEEMTAGLERIGTWQDDYRREHPGATDEEVDAAFRAGMANIELWQAKYKKDHPDATKAEMDAAFSAMWSDK